MGEFEKISERPPFTIEQLRSAIPSHLFERSTTKSVQYFIRDLIIIFFLYFLAYLVQPLLIHPVASAIFFPLWWFSMGTMFWSLFVVGHDCGHRSFSESTFICDVFGLLSHTPILVPFHSWRLSHHKHHSHTGNIRHDESFIAVPKTFYLRMYWIIWLFRFHLFNLGWSPYLIFGMPLAYYSHFNPKAKIFKSEDFYQVLISVLFVILFVFGILFPLSMKFGFWFVFVYYWIPYFIFGSWIGLVTLLHHTHPDIPWYRSPDWSYLRGALSTVDRNYGLIEPIHHNIGTHIVHHLFMKIPHYHIVEATKYIKPILGKYYKKSELSVWSAIQKTWQECHFVDDEGSVVFYEKSSSFPFKEIEKKQK